MTSYAQPTFPTANDTAADNVEDVNVDSAAAIATLASETALDGQLQDQFLDGDTANVNAEVVTDASGLTSAQTAEIATANAHIASNAAFATSSGLSHVAVEHIES
jgi:hypothetical protein